MAQKYSKEECIKQISKAASDMGVEPCMMVAFAHIETGGTFNNLAGNGPYKGLFQFHVNTIKELGGTDADRFDPYQSTKYAIKYMLANKKIFEKKYPGKSWADWMAYVCHQQGAGGCSDIFGSSDNTLIAGHKREKAIRNNTIGKTKLTTIGQFKNMWANRFDTVTSSCSSSCPVPKLSGLSGEPIQYSNDGCKIEFDSNSVATNSDNSLLKHRNFFLVR